MTDREVLELAAKAAGKWDWVWDEENNEMRSSPRATPYGEAYAYWNPLVNDAEAFSLGIALRLDLHFEDQPGWIGELIEVFGPESEDGSRHCTTLPLGEDSNAATRRAIVRAAAEIGRAMG